MFTNGDARLRHLPPIHSPPPPKRYKSESTSASDAGHSRYYSHSLAGSDRVRSRQPSSAMDLYTLIDRDPVDKDPRRNARFASNGSVATQASHASNASQVSRSSPIILSDHKYATPCSIVYSMTDLFSQDTREIPASQRERPVIPWLPERNLPSPVRRGRTGPSRHIPQIVHRCTGRGWLALCTTPHRVQDSRPGLWNGYLEHRDCEQIPEFLRSRRRPCANTTDQCPEELRFLRPVRLRSALDHGRGFMGYHPHADGMWECRKLAKSLPTGLPASPAGRLV